MQTAATADGTACPSVGAGMSCVPPLALLKAPWQTGPHLTPLHSTPPLRRCSHVPVNLDHSRPDAGTPQASYPDICFAVDPCDDAVQSQVSDVARPGAQTGQVWVGAPASSGRLADARSPSGPPFVPAFLHSAAGASQAGVPASGPAVEIPCSLSTPSCSAGAAPARGLLLRAAARRRGAVLEPACRLRLCRCCYWRASRRSCRWGGGAEAGGSAALGKAQQQGWWRR